MAPNRNPEPSPSDPPSPDLKLCGFLLLVVSADPCVPLGSPCSLAADGDAAAFVLEDGTLLNPLPDGNAAGAPAEGTPGSARKRRRKAAGSVRGSASVVHQVRALVGSRCLEAKGTVVAVSARIGMGVRAAVAVDVYLPMTLWEGWQFPRCGGLAAALFRHVSCDWEMRSSLDSVIKYQGKSVIEDELIWNTSDCHVLGCKLHSHISHSNASKLFDLHEVFKSLPCASKDERRCTTRIQPEVVPFSHGIWDITDDILTSILAALGQRDLVSAASTCRHLRSLASSTIPYLKLKLFPHQEAAVEWMLQRERNSDVLPHPLYMKFSTEDGFSYYINTISGIISTGMAPIVNDFHGGMFCDEPGLGKTVTALSLILKTLGTMADPPHGVEVVWCKHTSVHKCGYYEFGANNVNNHGLMPIMKRFISQSARRGNMFSATLPSEMVSLGISNAALKSSFESFNIQAEMLGKRSLTNSNSFPTRGQVDGSLGNAKKARRTLGKTSISSVKSKVGRNLNKRKYKSSSPNLNSPADVGHLLTCSSQLNISPVVADLSETCVQCDACKKWRKLSEKSSLDPLAAWFCSMNPDHLYQSCTAPEEFWGYRSSITSLPGFYTKGTSPGKEENASFFWSILKENFTLMDSVLMKSLTWLAKLTSSKLLEMERNGLSLPIVAMRYAPGQQSREYEKIFQAFGLVRKVIRGTSRWFYPCDLENLTFDSVALQIALSKPLDSFRLYMSRATLVIVPANFVEHWKTQVRKVVSSGHLRVLVWADHKRPSAHNLAWDYDIVITTFSRLSAEWSPRKRSVLMQVHWHRVMLDEGHTLGSSIGLTNKLQMAIALSASNRWILTGTPTPNTPNSQLSHLQPMLKFLHEEAYGMDQESWDAGIFKPFEGELEEGRSRLLALLKKTMISARKKDLKTIPPCIKKVTYLNFNSEHAKSYNELVVTVRRNILMADWNDPSHVESLLNPKQWKFRSNTIRNIRLSCCVAGHIKMLEAGNDIQDTMDILVQHGLDPLSEEYWYLRSSLLNGGSCSRCKDWCRLPVITPCRHLLCLQCVALDSERCTFPGCGNSHEMQFPEALTRPENPTPKWPVPKDLIELQPSYRQDNWDPDWQSTSSSKVAYLVKRLKDLLESNKDLVACQNQFDNQMAFPTYSEGFHCPGQHREMFLNHPPKKTSVKLDKVIIFSQFLEHIHVIEQQLTVAGIKYAGMYSPMPTSNKMKSLMTFQHDVECLALLMDGSAALGLDLSFVSHVFLMEPIWDRSIEEQVISRAHRMGATCPINVETLAMRGTIEEQMLEFLQDADLCRTLKQDTCSADYEGQRAHRTLHDFAESNYLAHLMFAKTNLDR